MRISDWSSDVCSSDLSSAANMAFSMYPGLTHGAYSAILAGGSQAQKDLYLPKLASFEWGGTMNLTEPHCGTDLGLLRTKAVPQADGSYRISGQKIWISGGEHDLTENIVHLVLARSEEHTSELQSLMRISYAVFCLKKKKQTKT